MSELVIGYLIGFVLASIVVNLIWIFRSKRLDNKHCELRHETRIEKFNKFLELAGEYSLVYSTDDVSMVPRGAKRKGFEGKKREYAGYFKPKPTDNKEDQCQEKK